jgi:hypothetical protein
LAAAEQERVLRKPPERLDAWEAYQRGLWHFHKYRPDENKTALAFFSQAVALEPNFAPGHYGYALALISGTSRVAPSWRFKEMRVKKRKSRYRSTTRMRWRMLCWHT